MDRQALRNPCLHPERRVRDVAALGSRSNDRLERHSWIDREPGARVEQFPVSGVAEHQAIVGVEEDETLGRILDGVHQPAACVIRLLEKTLDLVEEARSLDRGRGIGRKGPGHVGMLVCVEIGIQLVEGGHLGARARAR